MWLKLTEHWFLFLCIKDWCTDEVKKSKWKGCPLVQLFCNVKKIKINLVLFFSECKCQVQYRKDTPHKTTANVFFLPKKYSFLKKKGHLFHSDQLLLSKNQEQEAGNCVHGKKQSCMILHLKRDKQNGGKSQNPQSSAWTTTFCAVSYDKVQIVPRSR